jgi:hypothetical protein
MISAAGDFANPVLAAAALSGGVIFLAAGSPARPILFEEIDNIENPFLETKKVSEGHLQPIIENSEEYLTHMALADIRRLTSAMLSSIDWPLKRVIFKPMAV